MPAIRIVILLIACLLVACKTTNSLDAYQKLSDKQIYGRSEENMKKHRYEQATKDFEALDALYPFGDYSQKAQLAIITAYYKNDDHESALAAVDRYIRLYPRADNVDYAYYMKGVINSGSEENWFFSWIHAKPDQKDVSAQIEAFHNFSDLIERFPNSQYIPDAKLRLAALRSLVAQHELDISQYYFKRKAFIAAANRASEIINRYPGTPQTPIALSVMIKSYRALNENDMADETLHKLSHEYPNSTEAITLKK